jgi:hypothetical protein
MMMKPFACALTMLVPLSAQAALQCDAYDELVAQSVMIMQIGDITLTRPPFEEIRCTLQGTVLVNFLGPHEPGTRIQTEVTCDGYALQDNEIPNIEIGPAIYWDYDRMAASPVIELHIAPGGGPSGAGAGIVLLDAVTETPQYSSFCGN